MSVVTRENLYSQEAQMRRNLHKNRSCIKNIFIGNSYNLRRYCQRWENNAGNVL